MPPEIAKAYEPQDVEAKWYATWEEAGCFRGKLPTDADAAPHSIVIPPPNVTGVLHMGHILNNTMQDILTRRARQEGKAAVWVPGTDHAGIATQSRVEKALREEGLTKWDLGREKFVERAKHWRDEHGGIILNQLKKLGCSCDWSRTVHTLDTATEKAHVTPRPDNAGVDYYRAVVTAFVELFHKGHIYRGKRMVNWCPKTQTALSDEEVIMKPTKGFLFKMKYAIAERPGEFIEISTTRPETLMGDVAVAFHPDDERYQHLKGLHAVRPFPRAEIPFITDEHVEREFGTGMLKVTPAHDRADYDIYLRHKDFLDAKFNGGAVIDCLTPDGKINCPEVPELHGKDRFEARKLAANLLEEKSLLVEKEKYENNVGFSERADVPIEPRLSDQWWLRYPKVEEAKEAVASGKIKFYPERWTKTYQHWLENIQDWCISRQLWWGHRIPVWYRKGIDRAALTEEDLRDPAKVYVGVDGPADPENWEQEEDVLDTWASSWLWPFGVFGWPGEDNTIVNGSLTKDYGEWKIDQYGYAWTSTMHPGKVFFEPREGRSPFKPLGEPFLIETQAFALGGIQNWSESAAVNRAGQLIDFQAEDPEMRSVYHVVQVNDLLEHTLKMTGQLLPDVKTYESWLLRKRDEFLESGDHPGSSGNPSLGSRNDSESLMEASGTSGKLSGTSGTEPQSTGDPEALKSNPGASKTNPGASETVPEDSSAPSASPRQTSNPQELAFWYPTEVLCTGPDIIFFWVARMIMAGLEFMGDVPFKHVVFNGIIRDAQGRKMSKSLGNSPDPLDLIDKFGADGLRLGMLMMAPKGSDILFSEDRVQQGRNFCNKLWNACRFKLMNETGEVGEKSLFRILRALKPAQFDADDHAILAKLIATLDETAAAYHGFEFNRLTDAIYKFFWTDYCDWYVEVSKSKLRSEDQRDGCIAILDLCLRSVLQMLHPVTPFITEELWNKMGYGDGFIQDAGLVTAEKLRKEFDAMGLTLDAAAIREVEQLQDFVVKARALKAQYSLAAKNDVTFYVVADAADCVILDSHHEKLKRLAGAGAIEPRDTISNMPSELTALGNLYLDLAGSVDVAAEKKKLQKQIDGLDKAIAGAEKQLSNEKFVNSAPADVIEARRATLVENQAKRVELVKLREGLG